MSLDGGGDEGRPAPQGMAGRSCGINVEAASEFGGAGGGRYGDSGYFVEHSVLTNTGPLRDTATIALVISPVVMSGLPLRTSVADGAC